jgi:allophanate hydrolase subunit 2
VLGSRSTYALGALGGFKGRKLEGGDDLPVGVATTTVKEGRTVGEALRGLPTGMPTELRAIPGLYWHRITEAAGKGFFSDTWKVAPEADRIGYRFKGGKPLEFVPREPPFGAGSDPSNITDACYPYGSIQVPGGTEPIVLHRDAVSGGGYFMVGTVISADMDLIGQLQPNTPVRFVKVEMDQALAARKGRAELLAKVRSSLASSP